MFKNWIVMADAQNKHYYFYGNLSDYEPEDYEGMTRISEEEYISHDLAELFDNILEDRNYHKITRLGWDILTALDTINTNELDKRIVLKTFIETFMKEHLL